jgi:hypothetical protein
VPAPQGQPFTPPSGAWITGQHPFVRAFHENKSLLEQQYGPEFAYLDQQRSDLANRFYGLQGLYQAKDGNLRGGYDLDMRRLANQAGQNDIDLNAARRQPTHLEQLWGTQQQQYANRFQNLDAREGFAGRERDLRNDATDLSYDRASRLAKSDATGRGAITSAGFGDTMRELGREAEIGRGNTALGYDTSMEGVRNERRGTQLDQWGEGVKHNENMAQAKDRIAKLESVAKDFGIQGEQLKNALDRALLNMGVSQITDTGQVLDLLSSNDRDRRMLGEQIVRTALDYTGAQMNAR